MLRSFFVIFFCFFQTGYCEEKELLLDLNHWQKVVKGIDSLHRPNGENWERSDTVRTFNEFEGKKILSYIREGDYAHAGEEHALDIMMSFSPKDPKRLILDVACGLGGSADYFRKHDWGRVVGFDIEKEAIEYAQNTYPNIEFFCEDVHKVSKSLSGKNFDIITIVNSLVCFQDQKKALQELRKLANSGCKLIILDYTDLVDSDKTNPLVGKGRGISFYPLRMDNFNKMLEESGWEILIVKDLSQEFIKWYDEFLMNVEKKADLIDKEFGENAVILFEGNII
jgi:ubiquinone/menaquinone biosynthesis C-methylase UbiE